MKKLFIILLFVIPRFLSAQLYPCGLPQTMNRTFVPGNFLGYSDIEIRIFNQTWYFGQERSDAIKVKVIPVGLFFNNDSLYNPNAKSILTQFIAGIEIVIPPQPDSISYSQVAGNWDISNGSNTTADFSYGIGKYKFEFYRKVINSTEGFDWVFSNYIYIDYNDIGNHFSGSSCAGSFVDMRIDYFSKDSITFQYLINCNGDIDHFNKYWYIQLVNNDLKYWNKFIGTCIPAFTRVRGAMRSDASSNNDFLNWPIDANLYNGNIGQENAGDLYMNLEIQNNHYARINRGIPFSVNDSAKLSLKHSDTYENNARLYVVNNSLFSVKPAATLEINKYGNVIIDSGGVMNMEENSNIIFRDHGEIIIESGGTLNDCRANISYDNFACTIINHGGTWNTGSTFCDGPTTRIINNGGFLIVNGGDLRIGDSSKIVFDGPNSFLKINPQSRIFLGENASIEFKNGAYLTANGGTFNSIDSLKKWKGIVLENSKIDSIVNCTISNAKTALTIKNSNGTYDNRVIKNNTFNIPAEGDHKGIYGENNYKILIQNNTFNMPVNP